MEKQVSRFLNGQIQARSAPQARVHDYFSFLNSAIQQRLASAASPFEIMN